MPPTKLSDSHSEPKPDLTIGFLLMKHFTLASVAGLVESLRFAADESFSSRQIFCRWEWMTCDDQPITTVVARSHQHHDGFAVDELHMLRDGLCHARASIRHE